MNKIILDDVLDNIDLYFNRCVILDNPDMVKDLYLLTKDKFLDKYKWIGDEEYNVTRKKVQF